MFSSALISKYLPAVVKPVDLPGNKPLTISSTDGQSVLFSGQAGHSGHFEFSGQTQSGHLLFLGHVTSGHSGQEKSILLISFSYQNLVNIDCIIYP